MDSDICPLNCSVVQRLAVAISCAIFWLLARRVPLDHTAKPLLLGLLAFLACIEKLYSIMNLVSVEKDWVSQNDLCRWCG
jgi:solute carrier family 40 (iron-regulated transporter), member 1